MLARALTNQFLRDLKVSWPKTALLGVLLLVGLYFWLPLMAHVVPHGASPSPVAAASAETAVSLDAGQAALTASGPSHDARELDRMLQTDPLVRSAEMAAIQSDPFRLNPNQFPPPVLFADETNAIEEPQDRRRPVTRASLLDGVKLKSTIVGVNRRAAFINGKLYFEGTQLQLNGESFVLAEVHARRVVLTQGEQAFELAISDPGLKPAE